MRSHSGGDFRKIQAALIDAVALIAGDAGPRGRAVLILGVNGGDIKNVWPLLADLGACIVLVENHIDAELGALRDGFLLGESGVDTV